MKRAIAAVAALSLASCAAARIAPDGSVSAWALGQARVERCAQVDGKQVCVTVAGGAISEGVVGTVAGLLRALLPAGVAGGS